MQEFISGISIASSHRADLCVKDTEVDIKSFMSFLSFITHKAVNERKENQMSKKYNHFAYEIYGGYVRKENWLRNSIEELLAVAIIMLSVPVILTGLHTLASMYVYGLRLF